LVLAEFEKHVALAAIQFLKIENVLVKRDRLFDIVHLDRDVIASVNLYAHGLVYPKERSNARYFLPPNMGSARVSRAGERVLAITNFSLGRQLWKAMNSRKDCFGATPKPTRGTRALPNPRSSRTAGNHFFL
jgi:hypothetical protein